MNGGGGKKIDDAQRIDYILANQFVVLDGPATVGDTDSACLGSNRRRTVDMYVTFT